MKKVCTNPACATRNIEVTTDADTCLACGHELELVDGGWLKRLFGKDFPA